MLAQKLLAGTGGGNLQFVGGRSEATTSRATAPVFSLTGLSGGLGSAPSAGDIVVACVALHSTGDANLTCTTAGYTEVADLYIADTEGRTHLGVYYKVLSAAETSVAFSAEGRSEYWTFATQVWRGVNASPLDVPRTTAVAANSGVPNAPPITTLRSDVVIIAVGAATGGGDAPVDELTAPAGMDNFFGALRDDETTIGIASAAPATPSTYDPEPFGGGTTDNEASWAAVTIALRPA